MLYSLNKKFSYILKNTTCKFHSTNSRQFKLKNQQHSKIIHINKKPKHKSKHTIKCTSIDKYSWGGEEEEEEEGNEGKNRKEDIDMQESEIDSLIEEITTKKSKKNIKEKSKNLTPRQRLSKILKKYDLPTSTLLDYYDEEEQEKVVKWFAPEKAKSSSYMRLLEEEREEEEEDEDEDEMKLSKEDKECIDFIENGFEARREYEKNVIQERAVNLHMSQTKRSKNIYATCLWYAEMLKQAEVEDSLEEEEILIPPWIRSFFTLEEIFEQLNDKQDEVDELISKQQTALDEAEYYNFVRENIDIPIDDIGDKDEEMKKYEKVIKGIESKKEEGFELDDLIKGIIPNVDSEKEELDEENEDYIMELMKGGLESDSEEMY